MDRTSKIVLTVSVALLLLWFPLMQKYYPAPPPDPSAAPAGTNAASQVPAPAADSPVDTVAVTAPAPVIPGEEDLEVLENDHVRYVITSHGGGIKIAELKQYPANVACRGNGLSAGDSLAMLNSRQGVPVLSVLGDSTIAGDGKYSLESSEGGVRATLSLENGMRWVKEFKVSTNYLVRVKVRLENPTPEPKVARDHRLATGIATYAGPNDDPLYMGLLWNDGEEVTKIEESWFANRTLGCLPGERRLVYAPGMNKVTWSAAYGQFFALVTLPVEPARDFQAVPVELGEPEWTPAKSQAKARQKGPDGYATSYGYESVIVPPGGMVEHEFLFYFGPREYHQLARLGSRLDTDLDKVMGFATFFGIFSRALLLSMNGLHSWGLPYGWAIIVITVIIKMLFWPLTRASTRSMKRMAALQPQMKALQEKYKEDPQKMSMKTMELYREHKVSPLGGCLPMVVQMPVFFGFFFMIKTAIELRGAEFLWICDLSSPDTVAVIPGLNFPVNPMPLIMGVTMLIQARIAPTSPGMDPMQQKVMKYLPLMFMVFLYNFSSGLTLYWTIQNLLTIVQTKLTRNEPLEKTPSTTKPGGSGGAPSGGSPEALPSRKPSGPGGSNRQRPKNRRR